MFTEVEREREREINLSVPQLQYNSSVLWKTLNIVHSLFTLLHETNSYGHEVA